MGGWEGLVRGVLCPRLFAGNDDRYLDRCTLPKGLHSYGELLAVGGAFLVMFLIVVSGLRRDLGRAWPYIRLIVNSRDPEVRHCRYSASLYSS